MAAAAARSLLHLPTLNLVAPVRLASARRLCHGRHTRPLPPPPPCAEACRPRLSSVHPPTSTAQAFWTPPFARSSSRNGSITTFLVTVSTAPYPPSHINVDRHILVMEAPSRSSYAVIRPG
ncbi:hypothetical protein GUJ93_ZPchr0006g43911 [Zizania palustris]|uniref:Uncharacterized protein n=1 Tax=Zizania palustris TaxID=103762 RepID=A0A8J5STG7_ZIZPA|nr:hypothetical protein GUJ93_ZPchr0006g43911 [Zizania palustris]